MDDKALKLAKQSLTISEGRRAMFPDAAQLPGGCWDLLFMLYIAAEENDLMSRRTAATRCRVSDAMFDRWTAFLATRGMIAGPSSDSRIALTADAHRRLRDLFDAVAD